jgi:hypothetical protein
MTYAIHIAVVLMCVIVMSLVVDHDAFVVPFYDSSGKPSASIPNGKRDHNEIYVPPVHAMRPLSYDLYGIPESLFLDAPATQTPSPGGVVGGTTNASTECVPATCT